MSSFLFRFHDLIGGIHVPIDDAVDKLNRKYTLLIFLFLALPIFTKQYIGEPIECFTPTYFTEAQARYVNSYCWTSSNYYIVTEDGEDTAPEEDLLDAAHQPIMLEDLDYGGPIVADLGPHRIRRIRVGYYQWAPLILLVQGFCFHLPFVLWGSCAHNAGVKLRRLLKRASDIAALPPGCQQREALLAEFVDQFHSLVSGNGGGCCDDPSCRFPPLYRCLTGPSRYLCLLYLAVKGLYVLNVGFQFLLLTMFMGRGFVRHGFDLLRRLATEGEWWNSPRFPLQTLCKVRAANQGGLRTNICRCVLPINVFNEKIFSAVWFYLAVLLPLNAGGLLLWAWRTFPWNRMAFVRLTLWRTRMVGMAELSRVARKISLSYLGWDGVFVLRLIEHNHGSNMATLILGRMWEFYSTQMKGDECDAEAGPSSCPPPPPPHSGASTSSWSHCACHVPHYGQHPAMHMKRSASHHQHDGVWEKYS